MSKTSEFIQDPARPNASGDLDMPSNAARQARVGLSVKLSYGAGAIIDGTSSTALTFFLLFYLTAVCGLSGTLAGTSSLLALLIDAFADPAIGLASDNTRSRLGRRIPYLLFSTIPLALLFVLLFSIPSWLKGLPLFIYATVCSSALRISLSTFNLPYYAAGAELTDDYVERTTIVSYRISFLMLGTFIAIVLGLGVFMAGPTGLLSRKAYVPFALACAAVMTLVGFATAIAIKRELPRLHAIGRTERVSINQVIREIGEVFTNRTFLILFATIILFFIAWGASGALAIYANRYFWGLSSGAVQLVILAVTLGPLVGAPVTTLVSRVIEKRTLTIANLCIFALSLSWPPLLEIEGLLPRLGSGLVVILVLNALLSGATLVGSAIGFQSMMADAADEHEFLYGVRREGLFFSALTFAVKAASGLGGFIAGISLDLIHFPTAIAQKGVALSPSTLRELGIMSGPFPAALTLLAPLALFGYSVSKQRHAVILAELVNLRRERR